MAGPALGSAFLGAAVNLGTTLYNNEKGFSARHEQAYDNQTALTQRLVEGLTKSHKEGDLDDEDHETSIRLRDEAIEAANDYGKIILDYKQVPTYNIPGKLKMRAQVRKTKRKVRQVNEQLQTHYYSSVSGSDTSSVTAQSGSPPGSGLENEMIRDWTYNVHSNRSRASVDDDDYWHLNASSSDDDSEFLRPVSRQGSNASSDDFGDSNSNDLPMKPVLVKHKPRNRFRSTPEVFASASPSTSSFDRHRRQKSHHIPSSNSRMSALLVDDAHSSLGPAHHPLNQCIQKLQGFQDERFAESEEKINLFYSLLPTGNDRLSDNSRQNIPSPGGIWTAEIKGIPSLFPSDLNDDAFEELCRLGESAGSGVHKVRHRQSGVILARKTILTFKVPRSQLTRELEIASSVDHCNIVKWFGGYASPSYAELKTLVEYCEGGSLDAVGKQIKELGVVLSENVYGRLAEGILQGLNYLDGKKIVHGDINPQHVLLNREGVIKLCNFNGTFIGTPMYMAPERISGADYTIRSDVWSTGITLLELIQNRYPFPPDLQPIELIMYITSGDSPRLEDGDGRHWSHQIKDFIKQTLNVDGLVRPTPKDMLQHVWITTVMRHEVHMAWWIQLVGLAKTSASK